MRAPDIKSKLTLQFVGIFGAIWIVGSLIIYFASSDYRREEFYRRLNSRSELIARLLVDEDEIDATLLQKIEHANPIRLPGEKISVFNYNNEEIFTSDPENVIDVDPMLFNKIRLAGQIEWIQQPGDIEILGLLYRGQYDRFVVIAGANDVYGFRKLANLRNILFITFLTSLIIAGLVGRVYAGRALAPISQVMGEVNMLDPAKLDVRVSEGNGTDEIALLGITFNKMLTRMRAAFESQKNFIANSSHEMRTPLTRIVSLVDLILLKPQSIEEYEKTLISVKTEVNNISALTTKLLLLTKLDGITETFQTVRVDNVMWLLVEEFRISHPKAHLTVQMDEAIDDESLLQVKGNEQLLAHLFRNVLDNACKYDLNGAVTIRIEASEPFVKISVADRGIGIPPEDLTHIGSPFFRASNSGTISGSGIGFSLIKRIVEIHGGHERIISVGGKGTTVAVFLSLA